MRPKKQIVEMDYAKPRFVLPEPVSETYEDMKYRMTQYKETIMVDDYIDIKNILNQMSALDPDRIQQEFIPQLRAILSDTNGRVKDFYIYPQHRPGGLDLIYDYGKRRYPKRLRERERKPEDRGFCLNGVEVGFFVQTVPYLHTDTWAGQGIGLQIQNPNRASITGQQPHPRVQLPPTPVEKNPKKRKRDEANLSSESEEDVPLHPLVGALQEQMPFLKQLPSTDFKIGRANVDNQHYMVALTVFPGKSIVVRMPTTRRLIIVNDEKKMGAIRLNIQNRRQKPQNQNFHINESQVVPIGSTWTLTNEKTEPLVLTFKISKSS